MGRKLAGELNGPLEAAGREAGDRSSEAFGGRFTANMGRIAKRAGVALGVAFGAAGTYGVKVAADFQQTRIAFEGILGGADEADRRLKELQQFAAGTPFEFAGLAESAQNLLAVGFAADDIIPTMTTLGNVAATLGVGEAEIKGVVRALGQMKGKGKASAEELQQISEQIPGFSAIQAIADDMGVSVADAFDAVSKGAVPANKAISAILKGMRNFPGAAGAMERQSKTLNGVLSTFKDTLNIALIQGIEPFLPAISGALEKSIPFVQRFIDTTIGGVAAVVTGFGDMGRAIGDFVAEVTRGDIGAGIAVEVGKLVGLAEDHPLVSALATALSAVGGAVRTAFDAMSGVVGFVTGEVTTGIQNAAAAWGQYANEGIGPVAEKVEGIKAHIHELNGLFDRQRELLIPLAGAAAALAAAFAAFQVVEGVQTALSVFNLLGPAIGGALAPLLANPIGLAIAAVVALAGAFAAAYFKIKPFREAVDAFVDVIGEFAVKAGRFISDLVDKALPVVQAFGSAIAEVGQQIAAGFTTGFRAVGNAVQRYLIRPLRPLKAFLSDEVVPAFGAFAAFVKAVFDRIGQVVGPAVKIYTAQFKFLAGILSDVVGPAFDVLAVVVRVAVDLIGNAIRTVAGVLAPILATAFDGAKAAIDVAFGIITGIIQAFLNVVEGIFDVLTGLVSGDFGKVWEGITEIVGAPIRAARDIIVNTFDEVVGFISGLPGRVGDVAAALFGGFKENVETIVGGARDFITTTFDGVVTFITGLPDRIGAAAEGMWDAIAEAFEGVINFIIGAWNSLEFKLPSFEGLKVAGRTVIPGWEGPTLGVPPIDPVNFAEGGIVQPRNGGTLARLAEAGRAEAVIPLPNGFDATTGFGPLIGNLHVVQMPGEDSVEAAFREARRVKLLMAG